MDVIPATGLADGRFRLLRLLGEGGMGKVYEATDRDLRTNVAIKMMRNPSPEALLRLKSEFRSLQEVRHENLVRLGELFVDKEACFFTMELVHGVDVLDHVLVRATPRNHDHSTTTTSGARPVGRAEIPDEEVWDADTLRLDVIYDDTKLRTVVRHLALALDALHRAGKVHRDLKPSNVLIAEGRTVLLDLGLAVDAGDAVPAGQIEGTVEYMAPEQAAGVPADPSADLYALGAMLYETLTARPPFVGDVLGVLERKRHLDPIAPSAIFPGVPADLDALCLALLSRDPRTRPSARDVAAALGAGQVDWSRHGARTEPRAQPAFIGRDHELDQLRRALDDSTRKPVVLMIAGEAGVGKSALVRRFAREVRGSDTRLFAGRCDAQESVPFRGVDGIADALTRWLVTLPVEERDALLPTDAWRLSRLFRVFERVAPDKGTDDEGESTGGGLDVRARRRRAFAVLRELLTNVARRGPTVLVIDDMHWLDADSVQLLEAVFSLRPPSLLLIGLVVPARDRPDLLRPALAPLDVEVRDLSMAPLAPAQSEALARALLPGGDAETISRIAAGCQGSPLFLEQMAATIASGKRVPDTLEAVLWERVTELDGAAREVIEIVSVAGVAMDLGTVARATGQARQELGQAVARLETLRLVRTTGARRNDLVEPYHDSVRQAVRAMMTPEQTQRRHRVLADALEKRAAAPWLVFHHLLAAGEPGLAAPFAVEAAVRARRELSARRVARLCQAALELLPDGHASHGELCRAYAVALANSGQGAEAARWYLQAADDADGAEAVELRRRAADHLLRCGRIDDGMTVLREVLAEVGVTMPASGRETLTSLVWRRARVRLRTMRRPRAQVSRDAGALLRADVCLSFGMSLGLIDTITGASIHALGVLEALRLGEPDRLARALAAEAGYSATAGTRAAPRTRKLLDDAAAAARRASTPLPREMVGWIRGVAGFLEGRYAEALEQLDAAARGFAERCPGHVWEQTSAELFAAWALSHLGRLAEAERRLVDLQHAARWHDDRYTGAMARTGNCVLPLLAADRVDEARAQLDEATGQWSQSGFQIHAMMELIGRTEADLYAGDAASAWRRLEAAGPLIDRSLILRIQHTRLIHFDLLARAALASGEPALLPRAAANARKILREEAPWAIGQARARLAALAAADGRDVEAPRLLAQAIDELAAGGLALQAGAARLRLAVVRGQRPEDDPAWTALLDAGVRRPERWMAMYVPWC